MVRYTVSDEKYQKFSMGIRGDDMSVVIYYVHASDSWYANSNTESGEIVAVGERLVGGIDLGFKFGIPGVYIADGQGQPKDPDSEGWSNLFFYILTEEELADTERRTSVEPVYLIDSNGNPIVDSKGFNLVVG